MDSLSDKQVDQIHDLLISRGVSSDLLLVDLLDHICCLVEDFMKDDVPFDEALSQAEKKFGPLGIETTQEATVLFLTLKSRKMKKITSIIGIVGGIITMFATLFKLLHWPGAGMLITVGIILVSLFYLPLSLITNLREKELLRDRITIVGGFLGGSVLSLSALFKIMHWPGFSMLFIVGALLLIIIYLPFKFLKSYRTSDNKLFNVAGLLVILAGIALFFGLYRVNGFTLPYLQMTSNLQLDGINDYRRLSDEVNHHTLELKRQNLSGYEKAHNIQLLSNNVADAIQRYRMDLLRGDLELKDAQQPISQVSLDELSNLNGFSDFENALNAFDHRTSLDRNKALSRLLEAYADLMVEISTVPEKQLKALKGAAELARNMPAFEDSSDIQMLMISCLNHCESRMKELEAATVNGIL